LRVAAERVAAERVAADEVGMVQEPAGYGEPAWYPATMRALASMSASPAVRLSALGWLTVGEL